MYVCMYVCILGVWTQGVSWTCNRTFTSCPEYLKIRFVCVQNADCSKGRYIYLVLIAGVSTLNKK